ncbi:VOC family protein [Sphingomonas sp. RIT328]|uniref:VOC family protein n=1 Tax=Sphingomonas sp. RIT328 TaxID=1470591 RepID=UPI0004467B2C|nr:VOC family protein [Sphingomonas sp. RIT328]EZP54163.1 Glyoxalase/bleomycin resistance protein/dioxygenase [Sphingomonas sp. RIT328]
MTAFDISGLRSVDFTVPDLGAAVEFYTAAWGLTLADRRSDTAWLRGTGEDRQLLALHAGERAAIRSMTFRATDREAQARLSTRLQGIGCRLTSILHTTDEPGAGVAFAVTDPTGRTIRIVADDERRIADPPAVDRAERLAHVNINSDDVARDTALFVDGLGFRLTDRSKMMAFVRTNSDHHSIVIAEAPVNTLNHVAFLVPTWEGVMRASGRMVDHGFAIGWGVGRHGPGDNVFAYFVDPFGFVIEQTAEVLQVDDDYRVGSPADWTWASGRTDQWGIAPPKSDACKAAQLAIPFAG